MLIGGGEGNVREMMHRQFFFASTLLSSGERPGSNASRPKKRCCCGEDAQGVTG